ncbi:MAG: hypothetical protein GWN58_12645, partial [Anaerolineae bacterium]|nr:hypothetical protein [Anaerolineae bacterium]
MAIRILVYVLGLGLLAWTLLSVTRTVILPRSAQSLLGRMVFRSVTGFFRLIASERSSFAWRDQVMALLAPIGLLTLMVVWVALVLASYMGMFWAVQQEGWSEAFFISGSSLLTL